VQGSDIVAPCTPDTTLLDACIASGIPVPYNCRSGECGECRARLAAGSIEEIPGADPAVFTDKDRQQGLILTCMCFPRADVTLDVPMLDTGPAPKIETTNVLIEEIRWHGTEIVEVTVLPPVPIAFQPGQYFDWTIPTANARRTFSAASAPGAETLAFHLRVYPDGVASRFVRDRLRVGDVIEITGPFGHFALSANVHRPAIIVAGGTGFAPVRSILDAAMAQGDPRPIRFFYGARTAETLYCADDVRRWRHTLTDFRFHPAVSEETGTDAPEAFRGNISDLLDRELGGEVFGAEAYLCGPPPMVDAAIDVLVQKGLEKDDIHYDKFLPAKR